MRSHQCRVGGRFVLGIGMVAGLVAGALAADPKPAPGPAPGMSTLDYAQSNPVAFTRWAQSQFEQRVRDYRYTLIKQELVNGKMTDVQKVEVRYRKHPHATMMIWVDNADEVKRALYKSDDPEYRGRDGERLAKVEPAGAIARLFVSDIMIDIDGKRAKKASRRSIADVGFGATFDLLEYYNRVAQQRGELDFRYVEPGTVDGRPTFIFERRVPESAVDGKIYVDAKMVIHIDQELLLPVAVYSYADHAGRKLLGRYIFEDVQLNPGLTDRDFDF